MALLVQKFGGTSVGSVDRIKAVAERVRHSRGSGHELVVVVSAMGKTTDELTRLAYTVSPEPPRRELDMLLASGEQVSIALLSMALQELGVPSVSMTGHQGGHRDRRCPRPRPHPRNSHRSHSQLPGRRCRGGGGWISGHHQQRQRQPGDHHPGSRRVGHLRGGAGGGAGGRLLRDLHRCRGCAHHGSPQGTGRAAHGEHQLRRNAGAGEPWCRGAASPRRGGRPQLRAAHGGAIQLE